MLWVGIKSRFANRLVATLGVVYAAAAIILLLALTLQTWGATGLLDRLLQACLLGIVIVAVWLTANAIRNLGTSLRLPHFHRSRRTSPDVT